MAIYELDENEYQAIKSDLSESGNNLSNNKAMEKHGVGKRRMALIRKSKSYKSYLQLRRMERTAKAQNTPAKAVPGEHDLEQENQDFLLDKPDAEVEAAADAAPVDERSDKEKDEDADLLIAEADHMARKADREKAQKRAETFGKVFTWGVLILAAVGLISVTAMLINFVFNR